MRKEYSQYNAIDNCAERDILSSIMECPACEMIMIDVGRAPNCPVCGCPLRYNVPQDPEEIEAYRQNYLKKFGEAETRRGSDSTVEKDPYPVSPKQIIFFLGLGAAVWILSRFIR